MVQSPTSHRDPLPISIFLSSAILPWLLFFFPREGRPGGSGRSARMISPRLSHGNRKLRFLDVVLFEELLQSGVINLPKGEAQGRERVLKLLQLGCCVVMFGARSCARCAFERCCGASAPVPVLGFFMWLPPFSLEAWQGRVEGFTVG